MSEISAVFLLHIRQIQSMLLVSPTLLPYLSLQEIGLPQCELIFLEYFFFRLTRYPHRIYGDSSCNKENTFVGYKNQACLDLGSSFSIKYNHPKLYQYSSSDTCTGRSTSVDFSSLFGECENDNSLSLQYDYILSDGSSSGSGGQPTMKPTKKPTTKPTRSPTKKPTQKPTRKPTNKSLVVNDPSDGSDSSQTTPSESSSKPHHTSATLVAASVSLSVVVLAGLFVWYYKRNHENHEKYVPINGKEEIIVEIPEVL